MSAGPAARGRGGRGKRAAAPSAAPVEPVAPLNEPVDVPGYPGVAAPVEVAPGDGIVEEEAPQIDTDASQCKLSGPGLSEATVRQASYFWIQACDAGGEKRVVGGDSFFVAVRGPSHARAKVLDNGDGTYLVVWKPSTSGSYAVTISLFGVTLPGVPFIVSATTNLPCPQKCEVRGEALHTAISRNTHSFEILFRDRHGQTAFAQELDVFVEPVTPNSPRGRGGSRSSLSDKEKNEAAERARQALVDNEVTEGLTGIPGRRKKKTMNQNRGPTPAATSGGGKNPKAVQAHEISLHAPSFDDLDKAGGNQSARADKEGEDGVGLQTRKRTIRVRCEKTLLVRSEPGRDAPLLGRLFPHQVGYRWVLDLT